jgi:hypothetical protein
VKLSTGPIRRCLVAVRNPDDPDTVEFRQGLEGSAAKPADANDYYRQESF